MEKNKKIKADYDRLSKSVQVLLKPFEYKILERIRRESPFTSNAAFVRAILMKELVKKQQTELI